MAASAVISFATLLLTVLNWRTASRQKRTTWEILARVGEGITQVDPSLEVIVKRSDVPKDVLEQLTLIRSTLNSIAVNLKEVETPKLR